VVSHNNKRKGRERKWRRRSKDSERKGKRRERNRKRALELLML
jgi:hypothetical protein